MPLAVNFLFEHAADLAASQTWQDLTQENNRHFIATNVQTCPYIFNEEKALPITKTYNCRQTFSKGEHSIFKSALIETVILRDRKPKYKNISFPYRPEISLQVICYI